MLCSSPAPFSKVKEGEEGGMEMWVEVGSGKEMKE